ncbi:hypothetical protein GNF56_02305 [Clostridium perfringens]|uniref:Uncharacterized protein n=1 Tax=Clostridium perfringens E str. JGS1987 TaxID=451755 RepID=B1BXJ0_CLOPF|nr:hypothetical protein [Clostridium perfringens]EDT13583.1 hypothetical protein AC3_2080 [Clostridium perfringens E str. JGS1987]EJT6558223.1 hypothetical protein [Clostridium perfringens]MDZ5044293.1 hypothetical protein [Clostridium perfringens]MDZ5052202.1 hypothetical protein [Clostridium perfringens]MDZ5060479.1 hypothetical protein [Clostridium perfringens]
MSIKVGEVLDKIVGKYPQFEINNTKIDRECIILLNEYQIQAITNVIMEFISNGNMNIAKEVFNDIFKQPNSSNGKVYEALVYSWLIEEKIKFEPQPEIKKENCLKKNDYHADGKIDRAIFDVKSFGIGTIHIDTLRSKLEKKLPDKIISIGGSQNASQKDLSKYCLRKIDEIVDELKKKSICAIDEINLVIEATPKEEGVATSISEFDAYEWAKNNKFYFMKHASQFCINSPYIIFCPFDDREGNMFANLDSNIIYQCLRALCRRIFIELKRMNDIKLSDFDPKAKSEATIAIASKKISAIVFLDVTNKLSYEDNKVWVYVNPNADNKLYNHEIAKWFRYNGAFIDDFINDNY